MQIMTTIQLAEGDSIPDPDETANKIFEALGADSNKDMCMVTIQSAPTMAQVGAIPGMMVEPEPTDGNGA